jgi:hypothetical protein
MMKRSDVLATAEAIITGERQAQYGPPRRNFYRAAVGWEVILGVDVTPEQVGLCLAWLKMARLAECPHLDSYIDACGYLALAAELAPNEGADR